MIENLANLPVNPGIYQMLDAEGQVLYVGKALNLKKRVSSYFSQRNQSVKTQALIRQIHQIKTIITQTETEALLLESNLIKTLRPKYNVLMRDDKSYPFLHIETAHDFPRIEIKRCKKKPTKGDFFGPYPSAAAVREALTMLQKVFQIRTCTDPFFSARTRPCLQYQIKRCTAPCTAYISKGDYAEALKHAKLFLQGKSQDIIDHLAERMSTAVERLDFEQAAVFRDQIKQLRLIQEQQSVTQATGDADVIVLDVRPGFACVQCLRIREGQVLSNESFFPKVPTGSLADEEGMLWQHVFEAFIAYYYFEMPERIPSLILTNHDILDVALLEETLTNLRGLTCHFKVNPRGAKARWLNFATHNLYVSIAKHNVATGTLKKRWQALAEFLECSKESMRRIECMDISHTQGVNTVASCVVFDEHGPCKRDYRRFDITNITPGDDYHAMEQVIFRRYKRLLLENKLPDVLIVDGGKGQVAVAKRVLAELNITNITLLGIAKGPARKVGMERLILAYQNQEQTLPNDSPILHLLQYIRDEAHRFAITSHRKKRQKASLSSSLENIVGVGAKKRQALLQRFGGLRELSNASIDEILKVRGVSQALAKRIYEHFHPEFF